MQKFEKVYTPARNEKTPVLCVARSSCVHAGEREGSAPAGLCRRRHRPPRSATTSFCHRPPPPPQTAPQRARKNAAATDRPGTRGARFADWQKRHRPAAQLLPHNARGLLIGNRRHRPPRSAPLLPQTAPAATDRPAAQLLLLDGRRACRHRPPPMRSGLEDAERTAVLRSSAGKKRPRRAGWGVRVGRGPGWTK